MKQLEEIDNYTYKTLGELLFDTVPEYETIFNSNPYKDQDLIGSYSFMNDFASTLVEKIKRDAPTDFVKNSFKFINKIGETNNLEILNILRVGILETLYTSGIDVRKKTNELLSDKIKSMFQAFSKFYH